MVTSRTPPRHPRSLPPPSIPTEKKHFYQQQCWLLGQAAVLRVPTRRPKRQQEDAGDHARNHARDRATRDRENPRTSAPTTKLRTERGATAQPTVSIQRRRRTKLHRARGRPYASPRQPRKSAPSSRTRQSATVATWALRARSSASLRAPGTGTSTPTPRTWLWRWRRPSERSTTQKRYYSGVRHVDVCHDDDIEQAENAA